MTSLPETLSPPIIALIAAAIVVVILIFLRGMGGGGKAKTQTAEMIAAVQAERDTLRANHAVTVARLEEKLQEARARLNENVEAVIAAKGSETKIAALTETAEDLQRKLDAATEHNSALQVRADKLTTEGADLNRLLADHEGAQKAVEEQSQTISDLRRELQDALKRATIATSSKASLSEELDELRLERDRLRTAADEQSQKISDLRGELQSAVSSVSRQGSGANLLDELRRERDEAIGKADELEETVVVLRTEMQELADRLSQANAAVEEVRASTGDIAALRESETHLKKLLREREVTVNELRAALGARPDGPAPAPAAADPAEIANAESLRAALADAETREKAAGARLATVAGERDALQNRLAAAERESESARVELERKATTLELRDQTISELEVRVRDHFKDLHEAKHRAETAEAQLAAQPGGADLVDAGATVARVQGELDALRLENTTLRDEVDAAKAAKDEDPTELKSALDALARENAVLRQQHRPGALLSADDVTALRSQLNQLAARFLEQAEGGSSEDAARSLAERIRAFKAARAAGLEPGRR